MSTFETKISKVKAHLKSGKSITSWEAILLYECTRLAAVKKELEKRHGMNIDSMMVYENGTKYAVYTLVSDEGLKNEIRDYLKRGNFITEEVAMQLFDCDHLKVVIRDLRNEGLDIIEESHKPLCGKRFTRYYCK